MVKKVFMSDQNIAETKEWLDALRDVIEAENLDRAIFLVSALIEKLRLISTLQPIGTVTPMVNTLSADPEFPAHEENHMKAFGNMVRWNAAAMVSKGAKKASELGGHIATYASIADIYSVALAYFCRGRSGDRLEDLVYYQGHSTPGLYARSFLEGRITEEQLLHFRQETRGKGVASYPHPWTMPDYWQFATVSMGLTAVQAIYQARLQKYLIARKLLPESDRRVWAFMGDGEMDEIESLGGIRIASRENLDNLIYVINCNLQRLDGPVCANHNVIDELEGMFLGAGWRVIKSVWNRAMDRLLEKDTEGLLKAKLSNFNDGQLQRISGLNAQQIREEVFNDDPRLKAMIDGWSDEDIDALGRAGHDCEKIFSSFNEAQKTKGQPTVVLLMTTKGYGVPGVAGTNTAHNTKKMAEDTLVEYAKLLEIPLSLDKAKQGDFYHPGEDNAAIKFIRQRRQALGGYIPARHAKADVLKAPDLKTFASICEGSKDREVSSTMMLVRILSLLLREAHLKDRIVPIVPDESRTFGMEGLFRQIGIYSPLGQQYEPVDAGSIMYYKEAKDGQYIQEGVNEGGAVSSWIAAATSYSSNALSLIPFYIYYSMFGFQRVGDYIWAAGDMRARGFLIGATAGRTTLAGEGLQHNDGNSLHISSLVPNCVSYDPTYGYELAVIIRHGIYRMFEKQEDVFFYISVMNENYIHPAMPKNVEEDIIKGMYLLQKSKKPQIHLLGSGTILREVEKAKTLLEKDYGIEANVWSVTSFTELAREAAHVERHNRVCIEADEKQSHIELCLNDGLPIVVATDYVKTYPQQVQPYIDNPMTVLGTDGFGRSDTRLELRQFHEVNTNHIAYAALYHAYKAGQLSKKALIEAKKKLDIPDEDPQDTIASLYQGVKEDI
ncbi:MAG: pyruvate dehydrogenase (acetyl-transferring), homodimeric type [Pseudomonadota bacterium]|nr:pyruvate dehydrogenase (acetyl-transferring), homodimeric type [Pseudomonadota bacterium]